MESPGLGENPTAGKRQHGGKKLHLPNGHSPRGNMQIVRAIHDANLAGNTRCYDCYWLPSADNYVADAASRLRPQQEIDELAQRHIAAAQAQAAAGTLPPAWQPLLFPYQGFQIHRFINP